MSCLFCQAAHSEISFNAPLQGIPPFSACYMMLRLRLKKHKRRYVAQRSSGCHVCSPPPQVTLQAFHAWLTQALSSRPPCLPLTKDTVLWLARSTALQSDLTKCKRDLRDVEEKIKMHSSQNILSCIYTIAISYYTLFQH